VQNRLVNADKDDTLKDVQTERSEELTVKSFCDVKYRTDSTLTTVSTDFYNNCLADNY